MLQEAVPYDFGGIDVIDKLTVAPSKKKESKESDEEEKPESTTQSTISTNAQFGEKFSLGVWLVIK